METQVQLKCDECGTAFKRPKKYKEYQEKSPNVLWKWKLMYCDSCFHHRSIKAINRLPEVLNAIVNDSKS